MDSTKTVKLKIAYIMSRFPVITETFILMEMMEAMRQGIELRIYPLIKQKENIRHKEVDALLPYTRFLRYFSKEILWANLTMLTSRPKQYLGCLITLIFRQIRPFSGKLKSLALFPESVAIAQLIEEQKVDCVHAHFATFPATAAWIVARLIGVPFTFTAHASDIYVHQHILKIKVCEALRTIAISEYNRKFILDRIGEHFANRISVIHCGVEVGRYRETGQIKKPDDGSVINIICVGSLTEYKGHKFLIEACRLLDNRGVDFICHLVGDGPLRPEIAKQIKESGIDKRLILHGACPRDQVIAMLQQADIKVLASIQTPEGRSEGIPVALMEAMVSELPIVTSKLSGIPELVEHRETGLLIPPGDSAKLADALEELCANPQLRSCLGSRGRTKIIREFALENCVEKLISIWREKVGRQESICTNPNQPSNNE